MATKAVSNAAIFRIRFVDEDAARLIAKQIQPQPIGKWELKREMLRLARPEDETEEPPSVVENHVDCF
jgi:hypothetical protein